MFKHYRTKGFVLKKDDRKESDQFLNIYSQDFGMINVLARSIRKITSKLKAGIPLFCISEIEFIEGRSYKTLTDAILIKDFKNIKNNLLKLKIVYQISETLNQLIKPPQKDKKIWNLLNQTFQNLNNYSLLPAHCLLIYYYFFWNLASFLGHRPELYQCLDCKKKLIPKNLYFSKKGGIVCQFCQQKTDEQMIKIDPATIKILREILIRDLPAFLKIKITNNHFQALKKISSFYLQKGNF